MNCTLHIEIALSAHQPNSRKYRRRIIPFKSIRIFNEEICWAISRRMKILFLAVMKQLEKALSEDFLDFRRNFMHCRFHTILTFGTRARDLHVVRKFSRFFPLLALPSVSYTSKYFHSCTFS